MMLCRLLWRSSTEVLFGVGNNYIVLKYAILGLLQVVRVPLFCCVQSKPCKWSSASLDEVTRGQPHLRHFLLPTLAFGLCSSAAAIERTISSLSQGYLRPWKKRSEEYNVFFISEHDRVLYQSFLQPSWYQREEKNAPWFPQWALDQGCIFYNILDVRREKWTES